MKPIIIFMLLLMSAAAARAQEVVDYYAGRDSIKAINATYLIEKIGESYGLQNAANKFRDIPPMYLETGELAPPDKLPDVYTDINKVRDIIYEVLSKSESLDIENIEGLRLFSWIHINPGSGRVEEIGITWMDGATKATLNTGRYISPYDLETIETRFKNEVIYDVPDGIRKRNLNYCAASLRVNINKGKVTVKGYGQSSD